MQKHDLLEYWPRQEDVFACVKTDAEASSEAVSLAVHQTMRFERRVVGGEPGSLPDCDEHELLQAFLAENLPDGRVIVPIVGNSGTGKSHVVRWLDAQLRRAGGQERRVVIRIPKGTSLKGVLGILLSDLEGPVYDRYRKELVRAQEELDPEEAAGLLCEMLAYTLSENWSQAREKLLSNPGDRKAQECEAYCRPDMLPALLRNQFLRDHHFVRTSNNGDGVVKRLVEQLTQGRAAGADDDRQHLFTPEDLLFSPSLDREFLGRAEVKAIAHLEREDRRQTAVRILNAALDDAKQKLLRLDPTVSDLFNAIREQLLKERKELVLLVEDFAVLSGIQKQLLQVIIKEAFRDGRQVLCTMRTALAYTTGYMDTATVLTRANVEYRIPDEGTEEDILVRINRLVGAYLNAARIGQSGLERAYEGNQVRSGRLDKWIPGFREDVEPEARATLDAFEKSVDEYELFPFNKSAIRELSLEGCVLADHLVYNPRFVIQNVLNKVLGQRDLFEGGNFPPANFGAQSRSLPARVVEEVKQRVPTRELDRYLRFLAYWGGSPSSIQEIAVLEPRVFSAFGFDKALFAQGVGAASPPAATRPKPDSKTTTREKETTGEPHDQNPIEAKWEELLDSWRSGRSLPQVDANQLRKWIAEALKAFIDWDWDLYKPLKSVPLDTWVQYIYIPQAAGNEGRTADEAMVAVCAEADLLNASQSSTVQSALMAIIRFHAVYKGTWDYAGAEADLPRYGAFLERISQRTRSFAMGRYFKPEWNPIPALVQGLLIGARALGIEAATKEKSHAALIDSLFATVPQDSPKPEVNAESGGDGTGWNEFTRALRLCRRTGDKESRDQLSWQGHLLNLVGARQGQAETVHAVDVMRLKPALEECTATWTFSATLPSSVAGTPDFVSFRTAYSEMKKLDGAVSKAQRRLFRWRGETIAWLGDPSDKETSIRDMKEAAEVARAAGMTAGLDVKGLLELLEEFRGAKVVAALDDTGKLDQESPRGTVLTVLGRGHDQVAQLCERLGQRLDEFLKAIEAELASDAAKYGANPMQDAVSSLTTELEEFAVVLRTVESL
jgi:hypothetical protein